MRPPNLPNDQAHWHSLQLDLIMSQLPPLETLLQVLEDWALRPPLSLLLRREQVVDALRKEEEGSCGVEV